MKKRLYNARILTMEEKRDVFFGEVWVEDDRICFVGTAEDAQRRKEELHSTGTQLVWEEEIDCEGNLLMPGFKNAHTHSGMSFLRSYADDMPLQQWLLEKIFPMEAKLTPEAAETFVKLSVLEYLTSGVTSIFDMYIMPDATARACMDMGMRCVLVSGLNDFTSSIDAVEKEYKMWNSTSPLISYRLGFHAEYTTSKELLTQLASLANKLKAPVYAHMNETAKEVADCKKKYGMPPIMFLDSLGLFKYGGGGFHCVYMTEDEFHVLKKRRMHVITNPGSNVKLASGIAPINQFLKDAIPVAIGTDGPASNNCLDMFREMFLVTGLAKLRERDAACVDALEVLKMATSCGAKVMGLSNADCLAEGKLADIIMIDLKQPNMQPIHNIPKNLVYSGSKQNVKMTMIGGKILYKDGAFFTAQSSQEIYGEAERMRESLQMQA